MASPVPAGSDASAGTYRCTDRGNEIEVGCRRAARLQAAYYLATGVWPLLHRRSFERITGPKVDFWLVRTVGVLVTAIGAGLALSSRGRVSAELEATAVLAAAGLAAIDVAEVARGRIRTIYLADALLEAALIAYWRAARRR